MIRVYHNKGDFCFCCKQAFVYTGSHTVSSGLKNLKAAGVPCQISVKIACEKIRARVATTPFHPWDTCITSDPFGLDPEEDKRNEAVHRCSVHYISANFLEAFCFSLGHG